LFSFEFLKKLVRQTTVVHVLLTYPTQSLEGNLYLHINYVI